MFVPQSRHSAGDIQIALTYLPDIEVIHGTVLRITNLRQPILGMHPPRKTLYSANTCVVLCEYIGGYLTHTHTHTRTHTHTHTHNTHKASPGGGAIDFIYTIKRT